MKKRFIFIRPPRPLWPFNGPNSAFWQPLAFASLAASLRNNISDLIVEILDCPVVKMGWNTLIAELRLRKPNFIGIGEEAVSCIEGLRLATIAKSLGATVIAGGCTFGNLAPQVLATGLIDFVVHNEGEITIVNLVKALFDSNDSSIFKSINGISFLEDGKVIKTPPQSLIDNLDDLPIPAYDLLPMSEYGKGSRNHPNLATIEHSRGCIDNCSFCQLWRQMGKYVDSQIRPHYRSKSPERVISEIRILTKHYNRKYLCWVDPSFNNNSIFQSDLADLIIKEGCNVNFSAWMRADGIVRDGENGTLEKIVAAGLNEVYIGIENPDEKVGKILGKNNNSNSIVKKAVSILRTNHPSVFVIGSYIYGAQDETFSSIWKMRMNAFDLNLDFYFFIPLTPLPGTPYWHNDLWDNNGKKLRNFDFLTPDTDNALLIKATRYLCMSSLIDIRPKRMVRLYKDFFDIDSRRRRLHRKLFFRGLKYTIFGFLHTTLLLNLHSFSPMYIPKWYES